jgi:hypothetical protein
VSSHTSACVGVLSSTTGAGVGSGVGCGVGSGVGCGVGSGVGCGVGAIVGCGVGAIVGCGVGARVGCGVGARVGCGVGARMGCGVGARVGCGVGARVGRRPGQFSHVSLQTSNASWPGTQTVAIMVGRIASHEHFFAPMVLLITTKASGLSWQKSSQRPHDSSHWPYTVLPGTQ